MILRFDSLEGRQLLSSTAASKVDLLASQFNTVHTAYWGDPDRRDRDHRQPRGKSATTGPGRGRHLRLEQADPDQLDQRGDEVPGRRSRCRPPAWRPTAVYNFNQVVNLPAASTITTSSSLVLAARSTWRSTVDPNNAAQREHVLADKYGRGDGDRRPRRWWSSRRAMPAVLEGQRRSRSGRCSTSSARGSTPGGTRSTSPSRSRTSAWATRRRPGPGSC